MSINIKINQINVFTSGQARKKSGWLAKAKAAVTLVNFTNLIVEVIGL
ncbi:hypothetical protein [Thalassolituus sp.]